MSHRSSRPRRQRSKDSSGQVSESNSHFCGIGGGCEGKSTAAQVDADTCVVESYELTDGTFGSGMGRPQPTLDSLLASCGELHFDRREDAAEGAGFELHSETDTEAESDSSFTEPSRNSDANGLASFSQEPASVQIQSDTEIPATDSLLINTLRQEFRASIDDLKAAQAAAAESQSAVLKTLTEIIFKSSAMGDNGGGGLEERLSALEDRVVQRIGQVHNSGKRVESSIGDSDVGIDLSEPTINEDDVPQSWAEIRLELLSRGDAPDASAEAGPGKSRKTQVTQKKTPSDKESSAPDDPDAIIDVPRAIDPEALSLPELRAVFYERESFISTLIGRLRQLHQNGNVRLPAEELRNMADLLPKELAAEVMQTLAQLDEISRIGELELSLERARLARQVNQLDNTRQLIEHNARQLGLQLADDGTLVNPEKLTARNSGSRRWLSKLGFGA